nr:hypothetical protein [Tanacetum cinerariifolium]
MTDKYYLQGEIKKLEIELWNLKVKGNDVPAYNEHFQELTLICTKFVANETEKIDKYIGGLPYNIYRSVKDSNPKMLDETIELANDLMDQKLCTYAKRQTNNKRKADDSFRNNYGHQQQPTKRQNVTKVYKIGSGERKPYGETLPSAPSAIFITMARVLRNATSATRNNGENPKGNGCFECEAPGNFNRDCPKLKNKDGGNVNAQGWVDDIPQTEMPPRKRSCLSTLGFRYEIGESSTARPTGGRGIDYGFVSALDAEARQQRIREVRYGIRDSWVDPAEAVPEIASMTIGEVNTRVTELAVLLEHDT